MHNPFDRLPHILLIVEMNANGIKMEASFMPNLNLTLMTLFCLVFVWPACFFLNIPKAMTYLKICDYFHYCDFFYLFVCYDDDLVLFRLFFFLSKLYVFNRTSDFCHVLSAVNLNSLCL